MDPRPESLQLAALNHDDLHVVRPYDALLCVLWWLIALTRRRSLQLPKFQLTADVEPRVNDIVGIDTRLRRRMANAHVP